ncbi:hypothetical protein GJ496_008325 [Pomphorhynchus laevis]|nr:hypothetical protein GJ496_008325 [Pomphorhynchus laevis]
MQSSPFVIVTNQKILRKDVTDVTNFSSISVASLWYIAQELELQIRSTQIKMKRTQQRSIEQHNINRTAERSINDLCTA